jgi:hypothetical protein
MRNLIGGDEKDPAISAGGDESKPPVGSMGGDESKPPVAGIRPIA